MSETTQPPPKPTAPTNLKDLRAAVQVMVGQKIHDALASEAPSAAQLHVAMKWLEQTAQGGSGAPPQKTPMELAIEAARSSMAKNGTAPDLSPGPDEQD